MKKWLLIAGCSLALCGCTNSTIVDPGGELSPDFETRAGIELDWEQAFKDMESTYVDDNEAIRLGYFMNEEEDGSETLYITAIVAKGTTKTDAANLGTRLVKSLNDFISEQDFSIDQSGAATYGGMLERYNIGVRVLAEDKTENEEQALVNDLIQIGDAYRDITSNK